MKKKSSRNFAQSDPCSVIHHNCSSRRLHHREPTVRKQLSSAESTESAGDGTGLHARTRQYNADTSNSNR